MRHFLPQQNPLGVRFGRGGGSGTKHDIEIVGVVKDAACSRAQEPPPRVFSTPCVQNTRQGALYY